MSTRNSKQCGTNLIELMVAISIAAISLTVGVPSFKSVRVSSDRSSAIIELVAAARLARSEAALRGTPFTLCASMNGTSCSGSSDWSNGWIVFSDSDGNGAVADRSDVIKVVEHNNTQFTLAADTNIGGRITFSTFGYANPPSGQLTYTDSQATRTVQLTFVGRLHVNQTTPDTASS